MFTLRSLWLQFVQWIIENLPVVGEELTHFEQVDLYNVVLLEKLTDAVNDVTENCLEDSLVNISDFSHVGIIWLGKRFHDQVLSFILKLGHFWFVSKSVLAEEALGEFDVENTDVVSYLLVTYDTKALHIYGASNLDLTVAPFCERLPDDIICSLGYDASY